MRHVHTLKAFVVSNNQFVQVRCYLMKHPNSRDGKEETPVLVGVEDDLSEMFQRAAGAKLIESPLQCLKIRQQSYEKFHAKLARRYIFLLGTFKVCIIFISHAETIRSSFEHVEVLLGGPTANLIAVLA
ncbi:hypothetical protein NW754_011067 [Fusarium falciforme]|nr:hypothetical protein NW754_011067 [Fusarium falciforme]